jgi:hypothetical protein
VPNAEETSVSHTLRTRLICVLFWAVAVLFVGRSLISLFSAILESTEEAQ